MINKMTNFISSSFLFQINMSQPKTIQTPVTDENSIVRSSIPLQVLCQIHRPIVFLVRFPGNDLSSAENCLSYLTIFLVLVVCRWNPDLCLERPDRLAFRLDNLWFWNLCTMSDVNLGIRPFRITCLCQSYRTDISYIAWISSHINIDCFAPLLDNMAMARSQTGICSRL